MTITIINADDVEEEVPALTATCHTAGCGNGEVPILIPAAYGQGVYCGVCRQQITDIT